MFGRATFIDNARDRRGMLGGQGQVGRALGDLARPRTFRELFTENLFVIKEYQRGYSWTKDQLREFKEDLDTIILVNRGRDAGKEEHHNFGTIQAKMMRKNLELPGGSSWKWNEVSIADGQQRIVTCLLFCTALAERFKDTNVNSTYHDELKNGFERSYTDPQTGDNTNIPIIKLNHEEYQTCLKNLVTTGTHTPEGSGPVKRMKVALEYFRGELEDKTDAECEGFRVALLDRCELVLLENKKANEYMVFEARNARGKSVSELDKVKNFIQLIEDRGHIIGAGFDFPKKWFDATKNLDTAGLSTEEHENRVLSYSMSISVWPKHIGSKLYKVFSGKFQKLTRAGDVPLEDQLRKFVEVFEKVVGAYILLRADKVSLDRFSGFGRGTGTGSKKGAMKSIYDVKRTKLVSILEILMISCYLKIPTTKGAEFARVVGEIEKAIFRVYVMGPGWKKTDYSNTEIAKRSHEIYNDKMPTRIGFTGCLPNGSNRNRSQNLEVYEYAINFLCGLVINDTDKTLNELHRQVANPRNAYSTTKNWGQYFLYQYEADNTPSLGLLPISTFTQNGKDDAEYTLEHIMPKSPRREEDRNGDEIQNYWIRSPPSRFSTEEERRDSYLNRLGNLVMSRQPMNRLYSTNPYVLSSKEDPNRIWQESPVTGKRAQYTATLPVGMKEWDRVKEVGTRYLQWNKRTILHRQHTLANWAVERWKMDCGECDKDISEDDRKLPDLRPEDICDSYEEELGESLVLAVIDDLGEDELVEQDDFSFDRPEEEVTVRRTVGVDNMPEVGDLTGEHNFGPACDISEGAVFGSRRPGYGSEGTVSVDVVDSWIDFMKSHEVRRVVCLLNSEERRDYYDKIEGGLEGRYFEKFGEEDVLMVGVPDKDIIGEEDLMNIIGFLEETERKGLRVVVHCAAGIGRTGHVLAAWRYASERVDSHHDALSQKFFSPQVVRYPKEALGEISHRLGRRIEQEDYEQLLRVARDEYENIESGS